MSLTSTRRTRSPIFGQNQGQSHLVQSQSVSHRPGTDIVSSGQIPTKINPNYTFTPQSIPTVTCHYHPELQIRNFCSNLNCLMPLCPACIQVHQDEHQKQGTVGKFELLENCLTDIFQKTAHECNVFVEELTSIDSLTKNIQNIQHLHKEQIQVAKRQVLQVVDTFFEQLENDLSRTHFGNQDSIFHDAQTLHQNTMNRWSTLVKLLEKLNTKKCLKQIIKFHSKEVFSQCQQFHRETSSQIQAYKNQIPTVNLDQSQLYQLNGFMQKYIRIMVPQQVHVLPHLYQTIQQATQQASPPQIKKSPSPPRRNPPHQQSFIVNQPQGLQGQVIPLQRNQQPHSFGYYYPTLGGAYPLLGSRK